MTCVTELRSRVGIFASAIRGCGVYCFRSFILAGIGLVVTAGWQPSALAEVRVALVIGNGAYQNAPRLPNPTNDAVDVAASLRRAGFDTILATDLDKAGMEDATAKFARAAANADVAMFYYSGHAIQFAGINYLAPALQRTAIGHHAGVTRDEHEHLGHVAEAEVARRPPAEPVARNMIDEDHPECQPAARIEPQIAPVVAVMDA